MCHAMLNYRPGEVNPKQQLPFCCRSPCESRDCCAGLAVPSGSELPSSLMLIQYIIRARHLFFFFPFFFLHGRWCPLYVCSFFFLATHHPPVITTCSWGSVGPLPCVPGTFVDYLVCFSLFSSFSLHVPHTYNLVSARMYLV